jgi:hypothetical protein
MAGVVFLLIIVLIISGIFITAKNIAQTSYEIMENQYLLYEEQTGLSREELFSPIDEKVAKTFLTEVNTYILDMQVQALEAFYAMDLYNKYQNINLLQENCKKINKEIVSIYNKFETIETHNDPALKAVKEHILTMAIKPFYVYLNQTTSSGIKHDIVNINSATLELDDNYAEKLLFDFILVGQKAGLSDVETNAISKDVQKKYIPIFKQYEEFLTPEQEAILE